MKGTGRILLISLTILLLAGWSQPVLAGDHDFKKVALDSLYGSLAGGLVGAAILAFTRKPGDHLNYVGIGAAGGAVAGATISIINSEPKALAELKNGEVSLSVPTVIPDIRDPNSKGQTPIVITAELFKGQF